MSNQHSDALVFPNEKAGPYDTHNLLWRVLYPARKTSGTPQVSLHELRHTHATLLNSQGESMKTIQAQLGHASLATTDRYLRHIARQQLIEAMQAWECNL